MTIFFTPKTSGEVVERRWTVPVDAGDAPGSVSLSVSGVTVDSSAFEGNDLVFVLSAGTAAATGTITATVTTEKSRTLVETIYIPIIESAAQIANTARDYVNFAMRKIVGIGETPEAAELDDALAILSALIAGWRAGGADIGAAFPIDANTVIYCPDYAVSALRYNLLVEVAQGYGSEVTAVEYGQARRGPQLVKHKNLPEVREAEFF